MKLKILNLIPQKKMRSSVARRSLGVPAEMDYEEMAEPNMKLSRALLIVLVLHVVAVAGIVAFNTIKTRQGSSFPAPRPTVTTEATPVTGSRTDDAPVTADQSKSPHGAEKIIAKVGPKMEATKAPAISSAAKTYIVAKGDNTAKIAKNLKVSYDELLAVNHIDDPHKLQIGQKLILPTVKPVAKGKKSDG